MYLNYVLTLHFYNHCCSMGKITCIILALMLAEPSVHCARILGMLPIGAKSHQAFLQSVMRVLADAGHEVVVYSPFPNHNPSPNLTHVLLENVAIIEVNEDWIKFILDITKKSFWECLDIHWSHFEGLYPQYIGDKKIKELLTSGEKFDLIFTEAFSSQEFTLVLSHLFKAPVISLQAFFTNNLVNHVFGNPLSLSFFPDTCTSFSDKMTFIERLSNSYSILRGLYYHFTYFIPKLDKIMRKDFPSMPPLQNLIGNVSLMFINDHLTTGYSHPRPPNIIPVAGIHIGPPKSLPQEIQTFMDGATDGVIFFSLGTYTPDELRPREYFDMYINVFKKLRQRVLWKTRKENIEDLPENVMTVRWAPQQDILAHPKCVLFITHGGLLSLHEAVNFAVPVVSIPQFYDQHRNSKFYNHRGIGVAVLMKDVSEETMTSAIRTVLDNSSYSENMKKLSKIFKDRPLTPEQSVVFWTEYVLRHGGAGHLRPASTRLHWYQRALLDVLAAVILVVFGLSIILFLFVKRLICHKSKTSMNKTCN